MLNFSFCSLQTPIINKELSEEEHNLGKAPGSISKWRIPRRANQGSGHLAARPDFLNIAKIQESELFKELSCLSGLLVASASHRMK